MTRPFLAMTLVAAGLTLACTSDQQTSPTAPSVPQPAPSAPAPAPAPTLTGISISGAKPSGSFQLSAIATRSDQSTADVTFSAAWQSSDTRTANVSSVGYVTVVADGPVDFSASYQGMAATLHANVSLPKFYSLSGIVSDAATDKPLAGAHVQVLGGPAATTDANGKYTVDHLEAGRTLVEFSADGYDVEERDVTMDGDKTLAVALTATSATTE